MIRRTLARFSGRCVQCSRLPRCLPGTCLSPLRASRALMTLLVARLSARSSARMFDSFNVFLLLGKKWDRFVMQQRPAEFVEGCGVSWDHDDSYPTTLLLTNCLLLMATSIARNRSCAASDLRTYAFAPRFRAVPARLGEQYAVTNTIFDRGATLRIAFAAWNPSSFGRSMSSSIKSGFTCVAFPTASTPSAASPTN